MKGLGLAAGPQVGAGTRPGMGATTRGQELNSCPGESSGHLEKMGPVEGQTSGLVGKEGRQAGEAPSTPPSSCAFVREGTCLHPPLLSGGVDSQAILTGISPCMVTGQVPENPYVYLPAFKAPEAANLPRRPGQVDI